MTKGAPCAPLRLSVFRADARRFRDGPHLVETLFAGIVKFLELVESFAQLRKRIVGIERDNPISIVDGRTIVKCRKLSIILFENTILESFTDK